MILYKYIFIWIFLYLINILTSKLKWNILTLFIALNVWNYTFLRMTIIFISFFTALTTCSSILIILKYFLNAVFFNCRSILCYKFLMKILYLIYFVFFLKMLLNFKFFFRKLKGTIRTKFILLGVVILIELLNIF